MSYHGKKLLFLMFFCVAMGIGDGLFYPEQGLELHGFLLSPLYALGMAGLFYLCYYVLTLRCPNPDCRALQIYAGVAIRDWHWPSDNCRVCGTELNRGKQGLA